ncbi:hypothetical protein [Dyella flagellata]|uniref:Uncharacterized protein n=1 Tax=Dyella flagellata TaxID=1867833 RepID=A0ABQ5XB32_9GAMM|nr:hypothetical protein [Dyella flagellata]GLQ88396.1 hypothetical protein GCM10007898_19650 [Dyella flagellata]
MKDVIIASTIALGIVCASGISAAQDQTHPTTLPEFTITAPVGQYETYIVPLPTGYELQALVGNTHMQYVRAARAVNKSESLRKMGMAQQPFVSVAIDNSDGPGVTERLLLTDSVQSTTVAIVDVYCKRFVSAGRAHCRMFSRHVPATV